MAATSNKWRVSISGIGIVAQRWRGSNKSSSGVAWDRVLLACSARNEKALAAAAWQHQSISKIKSNSANGEHGAPASIGIAKTWRKRSVAKNINKSAKMAAASSAARKGEKRKAKAAGEKSAAASR